MVVRVTQINDAKVIHKHRYSIDTIELCLRVYPTVYKAWVNRQQADVLADHKIAEYENWRVTTIRITDMHSPGVIHAL